MKSAYALLLSLAVTLGAAPDCTALVINFDNLYGGNGTLLGGEPVTNQYAAEGVTFADSSTEGAHATDALGALMPGYTPPNVLWVGQGDGTLSGQFLQISFASSVSSVALLFEISLGANLTMAAYSGSTLVGSVTQIGTPTSSGDSLSGPLSLSIPDITSVQLSSLSGSSSFNFAIDNLNIAFVPEPGTGMLVMAGVLGLAITRRSRA